MKCGTTLNKMADGHLVILTDSWIQAMSITIKLRWFYGFKRTGKYLWTPIDESIYSDFVRDKIRISAGWDILGGYYFHAANEDADSFLAKLFGSDS
jgi:hypothetical protein